MLCLFFTRLYALQFVHFTDTHIGSSTGGKRLTLFVQEILNMSQKPDFLIHTGDITELGREEEFRTYSQIIAPLNILIHHTLGNHDVRWNGEGWLLAQRFFPQYKRYYFFQQEGIAFFILDSSFPFSQYGLIDPTQLKWLKETLASLPPSQPIILACHHPPLPGRNFLLNAKELFQILRPYNVVLFLTGHGHSDMAWKVEGINCLMTNGLMDDDATYRVIEIKNDEITISTRQLGEGEEGSIKLPLQREEQPKESPSTSDSKVFWKLDEAIQADIVSFGNKIFIGGWSGRVTALDVKSKKEIWSYRLPSPILSTPALSGDRLFAGSSDGNLCALDINDGKPLWTKKLPNGITGDLVVAGGRLIVPAGRILYALDPNSGNTIWQFQANGPFEARPAVAGEEVYIGAWDKNFYALSLRDGTLLWRKETARSIYYSPASSNPLLLGNKVIFTQPYDNSTKKGGVIALNSSSGEELWQFGGNFGYSSPVRANDNLLILSMEGELLCLSDKGTKVWSTKLGKTCFNSAPLISKDRIFVVTFDNTLFVIDRKTGQILSNRRLGEGNCVSTPALMDNSLVVGDMQGNLYVVND